MRFQPLEATADLAEQLLGRVFTAGPVVEHVDDLLNLSGDMPLDSPHRRGLSGRSRCEVRRWRT